MPSPADLLSVLRHVKARLDGDVSLDALAERSGWSAFHLHRAFRRLVGETPKAYTQRLRLDQAAARLAAGTDRVVDVALDSGFASHEVFTRAFTRRYGRSPERYRAAVRSTATVEARARHAEVTEASGPCVTLYHLSLEETESRSCIMSTPSIERQELQPQHALVVKRRVARSEIAATIAESLGQTFPYALQNGLAIAGPAVRALFRRRPWTDDDGDGNGDRGSGSRCRRDRADHVARRSRRRCADGRDRRKQRQIPQIAGKSGGKKLRTRVNHVACAVIGEPCRAVRQSAEPARRH